LIATSVTTLAENCRVIWGPPQPQLPTLRRILHNLLKAGAFCWDQAPAVNLKPNRKLFLTTYLPFILHGVLVGAGSLWPRATAFCREQQLFPESNREQVCSSRESRVSVLGFFS